MCAYVGVGVYLFALGIWPTSDPESIFFYKYIKQNAFNFNTLLGL